MKIYVSITCIDSRIGSLKSILDSILHQTMSADKIYLYLSNHPHLLDNGIKYYRLPREIKQLEEQNKIEIVYTQNTGPYRKLLPCLKEHFEENCVIITADDDTMYPPDWIETLVTAFKKEGCDKVIAYRGHKIKLKKKASGQLEIMPYKEWKSGTTDSTDCLLNFPTGKDGVLYSPKFFDSDVVFNSEIYLGKCKSRCDVWFYFNTLHHGIGSIILKKRNDTLKSAKYVGKLPKDTLTDFNKIQKNDRLIRNIHRHFGEPLFN